MKLHVKLILCGVKAWACVVLGCGATLGGMWMLTRNVKQNELKHSPYGTPPALSPRTGTLT